MRWNEKVAVGLIAVELLTYTPAAEAKRHNEFKETLNTPAYEQVVEDHYIDLEKTTGISLDDMAQGGYDYFEQIKQLEEMGERSPPQHTHSDRPPPTTQEMVNNLRKLQRKYISTNKELSQPQNEYNKYTQEANKLNNHADKMERRISSIIDLKGDSIRERELAHFEKEYHVKPRDAPVIIKGLREKSAQIKENLKSINKNIQSLKDSQEQNKLEYKNQLDSISNRPDKHEIMDKFEQSRKEEKINPRDIAELKNIERSVLGQIQEKSYYK